MKKYYLFLIALIVPFLCSCEKCPNCGNKERNCTCDEPCSHNKLGIENFKNALEGTKDPQILDYRSAEEYTKGHIPGAISMSVATTDLIKNSEYFQNVKKRFSTTKKIYIYGGSDSWGVNGNIVPGMIACDWGKENTFLLDGGFDAWVKAGYPVE